jgi:hypothetical protein
MSRTTGKPSATTGKTVRCAFLGTDGTDRSIPKPPPNASVGKRWRFWRNVVIYVAHRNRVSQRKLADVFDLPRSRISAIIREFSEYDKTQ